MEFPLGRQVAGISLCGTHFQMGRSRTRARNLAARDCRLINLDGGGTPLSVELV